MADPSTQTSHQTIWTNWVGNQSFTPRMIIEVSTETEVQKWVTHAATQGLGIRTVGTGHSFTPIVETDILLNLEPMRGVIHIDKAKRQVSALPKTTIGDFAEPLWEQGLALANQGDIDTQAIAGAIATATHGSGRNFGNFSSSLVAARMIDGMGNLVEVSEIQNADVLPALQTSLGLLGMMTQVSVCVAPAYNLHAKYATLPYAAVLERLEDYIENYRHVSFFWLPTDASAALYCLDKGGADDCVVKVYQEVPADSSIENLAPDEKVDRSYRIYPMHYDPNFHEMEYFLPLENARDILHEMRKLMLRWLPLSIYPLEIRTVGKDQAWMSPNYQRDNLVVSISGQPDTDYWPYLRACDSLFAEYGGRPHWGKLHFMTADRLERLFSRYNDFVTMRRRFDPKGIFLNAHTRAMFE
jgi:FAD/FMN-containing dehydrogenase